MKVPLLAGFSALLFLLAAEGAMTHWTIARLPLDQPRITDLRVEWLAREDGVRGVPRSGLLRKVVELLPGK